MSIVMENNILTQSLSKIPFFDGLNPKELRVVLSLCQHESFTEGEIIFNEGDASHCMYVVLHGDIDIHTKQNGKLVNMGSCDIFGEMGLLTQKTRSASAVTNSECNLLKIDHIGFNLLAGKQPRINSILMKNISTNLCHHVIRMNKFLANKTVDTKEEKAVTSQVLSNSPN